MATQTTKYRGPNVETILVEMDVADTIITVTHGLGTYPIIIANPGDTGYHTQNVRVGDPGKDSIGLTKDAGAIATVKLTLIAYNAPVLG